MFHITFHAVKRKLHLVFLALSLICFALTGYLYWQRYFNPLNLAFNSAPPSSVGNSKLSSLPATISLPDLGLTLPVIPAQIISNVWPTTTAGVSYLFTSARPGDTGNSIFYGHNWPRLLGKLSQVELGAIITISDNLGRATSYQVAKISRV